MPLLHSTGVELDQYLARLVGFGLDLVHGHAKVRVIGDRRCV